jgi:hypothetical protein
MFVIVECLKFFCTIDSLAHVCLIDHRDANYVSVNPCRPGGVPSACCLLDLENDFQESNPLPANCDAMLLEGKQLFVIEGGCSKGKDGKYNNPLCLQPGELNAGALPARFSLWSQMGAAGPFTNSKGLPLDGLPMKCVCETTNDLYYNRKVDYYNLNVVTPTQCSKSVLAVKPQLGVKCDGSLALPSQGKTSDLYKAFRDQGVLERDIVQLNFLEQQRLLYLGLPTIYKSLYEYLTRQGFTEWANVLKWPFITNDSCSEKGATSLAYPKYSYPPYVFGGDKESTVPQEVGPLGLCALYADNKFFCPAHQNVELQNVVEWDFNRLFPKGTFANGSTWKPYGLIECTIRCRATAEGTAYIGDGPHGLLH